MTNEDDPISLLRLQSVSEDIKTAVQCNVCLSHYAINNIVKIEPCQHPFCVACFVQLLDNSEDRLSLCPTCRQQFTDWSCGNALGEYLLSLNAGSLRCVSCDQEIDKNLAKLCQSCMKIICQDCGSNFHADHNVSQWDRALAIALCCQHWRSIKDCLDKKWVQQQQQRLDQLEPLLEKELIEPMLRKIEQQLPDSIMKKGIERARKSLPQNSKSTIDRCSRNLERFEAIFGSDVCSQTTAGLEGTEDLFEKMINTFMDTEKQTSEGTNKTCAQAEPSSRLEHDREVREINKEIGERIKNINVILSKIIPTGSSAFTMDHGITYPLKKSNLIWSVDEFHDNIDQRIKRLVKSIVESVNPLIENCLSDGYFDARGGSCSCDEECSRSSHVPSLDGDDTPTVVSGTSDALPEVTPSVTEDSAIPEAGTSIEATTDVDTVPASVTESENATVPNGHISPDPDTNSGRGGDEELRSVYAFGDGSAFDSTEMSMEIRDFVVINESKESNKKTSMFVALKDKRVSKFTLDPLELNWVKSINNEICFVAYDNNVTIVTLTSRPSIDVFDAVTFEFIYSVPLVMSLNVTENCKGIACGDECIFLVVKQKVLKLKMSDLIKSGDKNEAVSSDALSTVYVNSESNMEFKGIDLVFEDDSNSVVKYVLIGRQYDFDNYQRMVITRYPHVLVLAPTDESSSEWKLKREIGLLPTDKNPSSNSVDMQFSIMSICYEPMDKLIIISADVGAMFFKLDPMEPTIDSENPTTSSSTNKSVKNRYYIGCVECGECELCDCVLRVKMPYLIAAGASYVPYMFTLLRYKRDPLIDSVGSGDGVDSDAKVKGVEYEPDQKPPGDASGGRTTEQQME